MNRLLCLGLCSAALVACGNNDNEPTADGTATEGLTSTQPNTDDTGRSSQSDSDDDPTTADTGGTNSVSDSETPTTVIRWSQFDARTTTLNVYWEGAVKLSGSHAGVGFMELSGYPPVREDKANKP